MTNVIEPPHRELPPPPAPAPPTASASPTPARQPRERTGWHIAAIVVGCLVLLPALGMIAGGTALTVATSVADDGYFDATIDRVESSGVAVASVDLWDEAGQDEDWPRVLDWLDLDIRVRADGAATTEDVFIGIARTEDVEAYLSDASFDEVIDFVDRRPVYVRHDGTSEAAVPAPVDQAFWTEQVAGSGEQRLDWEVRNGNWSVVVMNADGAPGVAADVTVGVRSDAVLPIGIVVIVLGGIGVIISVVLIVVGARGRPVT